MNLQLLGDIFSKKLCTDCSPVLPEHDTALVVTLHSLHWVHPLDDGGLPDVADVDGGPEAPHYFCGMEEKTDRGLEVLTGHWLVTLGTDGHHSSPQLRQRNVESQGCALLSSHQPAGGFVPSDTGDLQRPNIKVQSPNYYNLHELS